MTGRWRLPKSATREGRRNEQEQLGLGHAERTDSPTLIETLKNKHIINAACGRTHSLCLTDEGTVYSFGDNRLGQLGIGCQSASVGTPCKIDYHSFPIVQVACGGEFSMILDCKGNLHSFGCQEYSQLGHNSNGKFAVKGTKTSSQNVTSPRKLVLYVEKQRDGQVKTLDNIVMKDVSCGGNHTVAMDMQARIFTWGFGGYGRLGHGDPRDEPVPRALKFFEPSFSGRVAGKIRTGSSYSMVVATNGQLYFWGQTKSTGEATMYPKPIHDLSGWNIRSVGCSNSSIVIAADDSVISWGPSPTYGELGYGENASRSSTHAQKAKPLEGCHVYKVACGMGHTLMIARDVSEEDKVKLSHIPIFDPRQPQSIPGTPYIPKPPPVEEKEEEEEEEEKKEESKDEEITSDAKSATSNDMESSHAGSANSENEGNATKQVTDGTTSTPEASNTPKEEKEAVQTNSGEVKTESKDETTKTSSDDSPVLPPAEAAKVETGNQEPEAIQTAVIVPNPVKSTDDSLPVIGNGSMAQAELPPPASEPLNLTMGQAGAAVTEDATKTANNLPPPPPISNAHQNSLPQIGASEDATAKTKKQEPDRQSSNGTVPSM
ncbi:hypothetical protein BSL78_07739 [Apostichopus japonicus]|uniref:RCC1-like domain-containing protein n=1 Tax=Stichopus japonicus TaxID=307972 RepID=A0A2G8L515_STIJA|nr:hypothetical protein BSL78_07739 [Apostichopus japonicus]